LDKHLAPDDRPRRFDVRRAVLTAGLVVVLGIIAVVAGFSMALHRTPMQIITGQLTPSPQELFHKDRILVLVEGLDYDYNDKDEEYSSHARSDVIWAVNLDFTGKHIYQLSIPRDMVATYPNGSQQKINEAQSEGGWREAEAVIGSWLGIPGFDRYMIFRVNTTKDLVNAIGGVDVKVMNSACIDDRKHCAAVNGPIDYDDTWGHLHIHLKPGMQHLNGDEAVGYMRFRHDYCGDRCRIARQQEVLHALMSKLSADKFNTLMHVNDLIGVLDRDVDTNFTRQEELSLAQAFIGMPKNALQTAQVPYVADVILADGGDAIVPDETAKKQLVENMLLDPPVPTPSPDAAAVAAINPLNVRVDVENGTAIPGAARRVAALLKQKGFTIGTVGNADSEDIATTTLQEHSNISFAGVRVREALGKGGAKAQVVAVTDTPTPDASAAPSDVTVIVGEDLATAITQQASTQP
jgi:LCP family protein required for cell wall assembly